MEEFKQAFIDMKREVSDSELEKLYKGIDTDNSGSISFSEYMVAAMSEK